MPRAGKPWLRLDQRGTALIEYAIMVLTLLVFFLGIIDTGRLLFNYATLRRAVEFVALEIRGSCRSRLPICVKPSPGLAAGENR